MPADRGILAFMIRRKRMPRDTNELAAMVVKLATDQSVEPEPKEREKDPFAVELGRRGGLKGGKARWKGVSKKQRTKMARKAVEARWQRNKPT